MRVYQVLRSARRGKIRIFEASPRDGLQVKTALLAMDEAHVSAVERAKLCTRKSQGRAHQPLA